MLAVLLLLVDPDADRLATSLAGRAGLEVTTAASPLAARAYLAGASFDAVAVRQGPDADALGKVHRALGLAAPLHVYPDADALGAWLDRRAPQAATPAATSAALATLQTSAEPDALRALRDEIGRLVHALNNPLAVIAGNAQLGIEMGHALGADDSLVDLFGEIDTAAGRLEALFAEVGALRARIDGMTG